MEWNQLAQDRLQWKVVIMVLNHEVPWKAGNISNRYATISVPSKVIQAIKLLKEISDKL
jgi:hypothetical protein